VADHGPLSLPEDGDCSPDLVEDPCEPVPKRDGIRTRKREWEVEKERRAAFSRLVVLGRQRWSTRLRVSVDCVGRGKTRTLK